MAIGIDVGTSSIKIISTVKQKGQARLLAAGAVKSPPRGMSSEADQDLAALAATIKKLVSDTKVVGRDVIVGLPESEVVTKVISLPKMSDQELASAIEWEAEQYIPMPITEVNVSYDVLFRPKEDAGQMKVSLVAAPKKLVEKYVKVFDMAGLKIMAVETELIAVARALVPENSGTQMVVDMGARGTDIAVVSGGRVVFSRSIATAGEAMSRAVAAGLSMEPVQAEEYKKAYGLSTSALEGKVRGVILPIFDMIATEVRKALEFYRSQATGDPVKSVIVSGGSAGMSEIVSELAGKLGIEVAVGDPIAPLVKDEKMAAALTGFSTLYAVAVGLSLREM